MTVLELLRENIQKTDEAMAGLFELRMKFSARIAAYKKENGLPVYDPAVEEEKLRLGAEEVSEELRPYYLEFLQKCMELSKAYQESLKKEET